jgi:hypothetical protein
MTGSARQSSPPLDPVLLPFLQAAEEPAIQAARDALLFEVDTVIKGIIGKRLRVSFHSAAQGADAADAEGANDAYAEALMQLLKKLAALRADAEQHHIGNWRGFAATVTYSKVSDYLRRKHPRRYSLENKLRFLFEHQSGFASWSDEAGDLVCGYAMWQQQQKPLARGRGLTQLLDDPRAFAAETWPHKDVPSLPLVELVAAILQRAGGPLTLDHTVQIIAALQNLQEDVQISARPGEEDEGEDFILRLPAPQPGQDRVLLVKQFLQRILETMATMSLRHRYALLLNLRDEQGGNALWLFPPTGVASLGRLASLLEMSPPQLAELWPRLPLPDVEIARLLDCERSQVINCRNSVRRVLLKLRKDFA